MSKPLIQSAAIAILCIAAAASPALAKKKIHHHRSLQSYDYMTTAYPSYAATQSAPIIGRYTSQDFYPNPLVLTITGMDAMGNLSGSMWGMMAKRQAAPEPAYDRWQKTFGQDARAVYRNGQIAITFSNGATYTLKPEGNQLDGQFAAEGENRHMTFMKDGASFAQR